MKIMSLTFAALLMCACRATTPASDSVPFQSLARGYQTGIDAASVIVARDAGEWRTLWNRHAALVMPRPDLPEVDFTRDMVVCVTVGSRPSFGYAIEIERIVPDGVRGFTVEVIARKPAPDALLSQIVTQPFHMIVTPRRAGEPTVVVH